MCTIMTFSRKVFDSHKKDILDRMDRDAYINNDGWSLMLLGRRKNEVSIFRSLNLDDIKSMIEASTTWRRFFLHARAATTSYVGLDQCHGFSAAGQLYVMHNGILRHQESKKFPVDSELIPSIIARYGEEAATSFLLKQEDYANCFFINPNSGHYRVVRLRSGNLYTDGKGNFSTHLVATARTSVKENTFVDFKVNLKDVPLSSYGGYGMNSGDYWSRKAAGSRKGRATRVAKNTTPPKTQTVSKKDGTTPPLTNSPTDFREVAKGLHVKVGHDGKMEIKNPNAKGKAPALDRTPAAETKPTKKSWNRDPRSRKKGGKAS